jgi:hypothetical protein
MSDNKKTKKPLSATKRQEPPTEFEPKLTAENVLITRL